MVYLNLLIFLHENPICCDVYFQYYCLLILSCFSSLYILLDIYFFFFFLNIVYSLPVLFWFFFFLEKCLHWPLGFGTSLSSSWFFFSCPLCSLDQEQPKMLLDLVEASNLDFFFFVVKLKQCPLETKGIYSICFALFRFSQHHHNNMTII